MSQFKKLNLIIGNWDAMSQKKIQGPCSKLKRIQISKTHKVELEPKKNQKVELKTVNKMSNGIRRFIHDTPTECLIHPLPC